MKRQGTVLAINKKRRIVAISTQDNGSTLIELLSDFELDLGDQMNWENG